MLTLGLAVKSLYFGENFIVNDGENLIHNPG